MKTIRPMNSQSEYRLPDRPVSVVMNPYRQRITTLIHAMGWIFSIQLDLCDLYFSRSPPSAMLWSDDFRIRIIGVCKVRLNNFFGISGVLYASSVQPDRS
jgi:hypothetical protein